MTAVEWLIEQIKNDQNQKALSAKEWIKVIEQAKEMEKQQIEISDEEIEKAWSIVETTHVDKWVSFKSMFIEGAKWYREQLKKKL